MPKKGTKGRKVPKVQGAIKKKKNVFQIRAQPHEILVLVMIFNPEEM